MPLLVDDADWDAAAERIHELVPELGDADLLRLLTSLMSAFADADVRTAPELLALASTALDRLGACWRTSTALPSAEVLGKWLDLAARLPEPPANLDVPRLWELVVPPAVTPQTVARGRGLRALAPARGHAERAAPEELEELGFPDAYLAQIHALLVIALHDDVTEASGTLRATVSEALDLLVAISPTFRARAYYAATQLRLLDPEVELTPEPQPYAVRSEARRSGGRSCTASSPTSADAPRYAGNSRNISTVSESPIVGNHGGCR